MNRLYLSFDHHWHNIYLLNNCFGWCVMLSLVIPIVFTDRTEARQTSIAVTRTSSQLRIFSGTTNVLLNNTTRPWTPTATTLAVQVIAAVDRSVNISIIRQFIINIHHGGIIFLDTISYHHKNRSRVYKHGNIIVIESSYFHGFQNGHLRKR